MVQTKFAATQISLSGGRRNSTSFDGIVGLKVGQDLNLHVIST